MSVMDTNGARIPAASSHRVDGLLDTEKTGAALLFFGVLLSLVGVAFTTLSWQQDNSSATFNWTKLMGPILISVGVTFMLTSVCRFGVTGCVAQSEDANVTESGRHSITLNHQIMLHSAVVCIPPSYNFVHPEVSQGTGVSHCPPVGELPPQYDTVCADNRAALQCTEASSRINRSQKRKEEGSEAGSSSTSESPPAYEDIYPSLN